MARGPGKRPGNGLGAGKGPKWRKGSGPGKGSRPGPGKGSRPGPGKGSRPGPGKGSRPGKGPGNGSGPGKGATPGAGPAAAPPRGRKEKNVANMKPKCPDEQEIPFRLREIMRSREAMRRPGAPKRRPPGKQQPPQERSPEGHHGAAGDIAVRRIRRGDGESERSYMSRVEQEVQRVRFLTKHQPQPQPEKQEAAREKSSRKREFQKKKLDKVRKKKEEKKEALLEKSLFQDKVPFGDVVTQPPSLTSRPRSGVPAAQAGRRRLLLTSRLGCGAASPAASPAAPVSLARQRIVQEERARVVQAYRDLQRRRQQQREARGDLRGAMKLLGVKELLRAAGRERACVRGCAVCVRLCRVHTDPACPCGFAVSM
ncbi:coiled-coil domain-containing protein 137 [Nothoprocta perdicaria]|uniref:coiled-coil domain-containing protein 137 n=1 Tax=Nothoprocta perdicaria TaxID=30464 RepID=UPI000E1BBDB8|nr:coiled-coil domain-containing protein 137 [Nothoprocta perdicaria]